MSLEVIWGNLFPSGIKSDGWQQKRRARRALPLLSEGMHQGAAAGGKMQGIGEIDTKTVPFKAASTGDETSE